MEVQGTTPAARERIPGRQIGRGRSRRDEFCDETLTLHDKTYGENLGSFRGQLLWTPSSEVRVLFGGDYLDDTSAGKTQWRSAIFSPASSLT